MLVDDDGNPVVPAIVERARRNYQVMKAKGRGPWAKEDSAMPMQVNITTQVNSANIRRETYNGREHLVLPSYTLPAGWS